MLPFAPLLRVLPVPLRFRVTTRLAARARRLPLHERDRAALASAERLRWGPQGRHAALAWGAGPLVLLVHGWGGRATHMAPLARHLSWLGFRALAPDITAHGESPGTRIGFRQFIDDVGLFADELAQPLHALIGHSAGGMTMMAARQMHGVQAEHYICLNAPRAPYPPIASIRRLLNPGEAVLECCREYYAAQFNRDPAELDAATVHRYAGQGRLMLVYDLDDDQIDHRDAERIARSWPDARIVKTRGLGHQRVLWDDGVHVAVGDFLCAAGRRNARDAAAHVVTSETA